MKKFYVDGKQNFIRLAVAVTALIAWLLFFILYIKIKSVDMLIIITAVFLAIIIIYLYYTKAVIFDNQKIFLKNFLGFKLKEFCWNDLQCIYQVVGSSRSFTSSFIVLSFSDKLMETINFRREFIRTYRKEAIILICNDKWDKKRNKLIFGEIKRICDSLSKQIPGIELLSVD